MYVKRNFKRRKQLQVLYNTLENIKTMYQTEQAKSLAELSALLKSIALVRYQRQDISSLRSNAWLEFLDESGKTNDFSSGIGRCLADAPYQAHPEVDIEELVIICKKWLRRMI